MVKIGDWINQLFDFLEGSVLIRCTLKLASRLCFCGPFYYSGWSAISNNNVELGLLYVILANQIWEYVDQCQKAGSVKCH